MISVYVIDTGPDMSDDTTPLEDTVDEQYHNWLKAIHFLFIAKNGLKNLVTFVARLLQKNAFDSIRNTHK